MDPAPPGGWGLPQNSVCLEGPHRAEKGTKCGTTQLAWEAGVKLKQSSTLEILITIYGKKTSREKEEEEKKNWNRLKAKKKKKIPKDSLNKTHPGPHACLSLLAIWCAISPSAFIYLPLLSTKPRAGPSRRPRLQQRPHHALIPR